jgi:hypothetical protein
MEQILEEKEDKIANISLRENRLREYLQINTRDCYAAQEENKKLKKKI